MPPDLTEEERYNLLCVVAAIIQFNMKPGADHKDATHVFLMREAIMPGFGGSVCMRLLISITGHISIHFSSLSSVGKSQNPLYIMDHNSVKYS